MLPAQNFQHHHEVMHSNFEKWEEFAMGMFQKMAEDEDLLPKILWIDEAHFTFQGVC